MDTYLPTLTPSGNYPDVDPTEPETQYVLPLRWSLYYALTEKQWDDLRTRHRKLYPDSVHCSCPKRCETRNFDETWEYHSPTHTKIFVNAAFICVGCHWLKTPPFRLKTWRTLQTNPGQVAPKPPHIIDCLGWTQKKVNDLRDSDIKQYQTATSVRASITHQIQQGKVAILPAPPEQLPPQALQQLVKPGQLKIVPWRLNLDALEIYGYSFNEILVFEDRMYKLAAKRMKAVKP
jgi:hypothetical protein